MWCVSLVSFSTFSLVFFFFSSRRRHTRCLSDWSSDVCSSDLIYEHLQLVDAVDVELLGRERVGRRARGRGGGRGGGGGGGGGGRRRASTRRVRSGRCRRAARRQRRTLGEVGQQHAARRVDDDRAGDQVADAQ